MSSPSEIVEFLRACLAKDEAKARAALSAQVGLSAGPMDSGTGLPSRLEVEVVDRWHAPPVADAIGEYEASVRMPGGTIRVNSAVPSVSAQDCAQHIARHDPGRALREVEAKRSIVDAYVKWSAVPQAKIANYNDGFAAGLLAAVEALAATYSDHPDYRPGWRL